MPGLRGAVAKGTGPRRAGAASTTTGGKYGPNNATAAGEGIPTPSSAAANPGSAGNAATTGCGPGRRRCAAGRRQAAGAIAAFCPSRTGPATGVGR